MKKILLIADSNMSLSGVPVVFMSIVRQLKNEYQFDIIVLKDNDMHFEEEFLSYGGKVYRFNSPKPDGLLKKLLWIIKYYPRDVKSFLRREVNLHEYDAIHSFHEGFSYPFFKEAKKAGISKRILHICSAKSAYKQQITFSQLLFNWYQNKALKLCSSVLFVSQRSLEYCKYKNKGTVLYNIYNEKLFAHLTDCIHSNLVLTQIATFSSRKNQLFALRVLKIIKGTYPNVILNIVGYEIEKGYQQQIIDFIDTNGLKDNVNFLGSKVDRIKINSNTSFILYPSTMESFGLVLIESQACGIHCFANEDMPHDADMGNTDFLRLDESLWAGEIIKYFKIHGNQRKQPINIQKFSSDQFIRTLKSVY